MVMFHLKVAVAVMMRIIMTVLLLWMSGTSGLWMIEFYVHDFVIMINDYVSCVVI